MNVVCILIEIAHNRRAQAMASQAMASQAMATQAAIAHHQQQHQHQQQQQKQLEDLNRAVMFQRLQQAARPPGPPMGMVCVVPARIPCE